MEYLININRTTKEITSDLMFKETRGIAHCHEGYIYSDVNDIVTDEGCQYTDAVGAFNLFIHKQKSCFTVVNDKFGILNLFYLLDDKRILFSNNFWNIAKRIRITKDSINYPELRRFIFFIGANPSHHTFISGINIFPPATVFNYDFRADHISVDRYWLYSRTGETRNIEEAVDQSYSAIAHNFESMREHFKGKKFIFGNSGGLDSRLIPHFAKTYDLDLKGFTVLRKRNNLGLKTATYISSTKIHQHYGFEQHYFPRIPTSFDRRLTLDIRNAPITSCNMLDNPYEHLSRFADHVLIYGNPAYLVGHNSWNISRSYKDSMSWQYFFYYVLRTWDLNQDKIRLLSECIDVDEYLSTGEMYRPIFDRFKHAGYITLFQNLHYHAMDATAHSGGFESVNRTMLSVTLYYPYLDLVSARWDDDLLLNRAVLKELNRRIDHKLNDVHDQAFGYLTEPSLVRKKLMKIQKRFGLLSSGMELTQALNNPRFANFANEIMNRDNPYHEPLGSSRAIMQRIISSPWFYPQFSLNFLKVKKILDIIYFNEYELLERSEFTIV